MKPGVGKDNISDFTTDLIKGMGRRVRQLSSVQGIRIVSIATLAAVFGLVAPA
jgi:hypothetical protein